MVVSQLSVTTDEEANVVWKATASIGQAGLDLEPLLLTSKSIADVGLVDADRQALAVCSMHNPVRSFFHFVC